MLNDPVRLTKTASIAGLAWLLLVALGSSDKGGLPVSFPMLLVAGFGLIGMAGYGRCKREKLPIGVFYLIVPILLFGAFLEMLLFRDIIELFVRPYRT
jgi:hypothetical protein